MGIFFNNPDLLYEFEVDGQKAEEGTKEEDYNADNDNENETDAQNNTDSNTKEENDDNDDGAKEEDYDMENEEDDNTEDKEGEDNTDEENDGVNEDDYTIEDDEGEDGTEGNDNDEQPSDEEDDVDTSDDSEEMDNRLKELEGELFDTLSDEQKQIKIDELKKCYQELHNRCDNIINIINDSNTPDENTSRIFEYLNDNMSDLKQYIYDYFTYTFNTKTYMENDAQYRKYLAILNSFNTILEEIIKKKEKEE